MQQNLSLQGVTTRELKGRKRQANLHVGVSNLALFDPDGRKQANNQGVMCT
jgi:hypothetical protein